MLKLAITTLFALLSFAWPAEAVVIKPLRVVTSFSILADMVKSVGGDAVTVLTLVGPDGDAHTYQPTPQDAKMLATADMIFVNGLGFEGWIQRLIQASGTKAPVITVTNGMQSRIMYSVKGVPDPHAWQNLSNGRIYIKNIAAALEEALPSQAQAIYARAISYDTRLDQMDRFIHAELETIPESKKKIITNHDAFTYFGAAYGVKFLSPVGISTEAEPSATNVAILINMIKAEGTKRIFIENMTNPKLLEQIAKDADVDIGGKLYSDALSPPDGKAATYIAMFQNNVSLLKGAMLMNYR